MGLTQIGTLSLSLFLVFNLQSLADFARQEAERRRLLDEQGIQGKVIVSVAAKPESNEDAAVPETPSGGKEKTAERSDARNGRKSASRYRTALQKLDQQIRQGEERLTSLQARLHAEKWSPSKTRRTSSRTKTKDSTSRLQAQIQELQTKIRRLREEHFEVYESGKKAGFMPGELDGKYSDP
jgi:hypothetical protein